MCARVGYKGLHVPRSDSGPSVPQRQSADPAGSGLSGGPHNGRPVPARLLAAATACRGAGATQRDSTQPVGERKRHRAHRPVSHTPPVYTTGPVQRLPD